MRGWKLTSLILPLIGTLQASLARSQGPLPQTTVSVPPAAQLSLPGPPMFAYTAQGSPYPVLACSSTSSPRGELYLPTDTGNYQRVGKYLGPVALVLQPAAKNPALYTFECWQSHCYLSGIAIDTQAHILWNISLGTATSSLEPGHITASEDGSHVAVVTISPEFVYTTTVFSASKKGVTKEATVVMKACEGLGGCVVLKGFLGPTSNFLVAHSVFGAYYTVTAFDYKQPATQAPFFTADLGFDSQVRISGNVLFLSDYAGNYSGYVDVTWTQSNPFDFPFTLDGAFNGSTSFLAIEPTFIEDGVLMQRFDFSSKTWGKILTTFPKVDFISIGREQVCLLEAGGKIRVSEIGIQSPTSWILDYRSVDDPDDIICTISARWQDEAMTGKAHLPVTAAIYDPTTKTSIYHL